VDSQDPRQQLARRLRALREDHWPGRRITQPQLAQALGGVSVPLISSWESPTNPRIPPLPRIDSYAALFATMRSFHDGSARLISDEDMSDAERLAMNELKHELRSLRNAALPAAAREVTAGEMAAGKPGSSEQVTAPPGGGPWRFEDGNTVTIACAQWPPDMLKKMPYSQIDDPDYIELLTYAELDSLFELHGHLRATNPASQVNLRIAARLAGDDYTSHLVTLGGTDWNPVTKSTLGDLHLPVQQEADWDAEDGQYFEVTGDGPTAQYRPILDRSGSQKILREDVALFARAVSPFNRKRTVTICSGMYGRGTFGAVRALTDARFRDRNAEYLRSRFGQSNSYCILTRVPVVNGVTLTPDWTEGDVTLFEWSE
jgi:hypothetical protein